MPSDHCLRQACLRVVLAAVLVLVGCSRLQAQTTSASVAGSVKDAQGGVVPGATVTLTSKTQGTTQTVLTDSLGNFLFPYVRPDSYTLRITLQGFESAERPDMVVNANDKFGAGTFTLEIGKLEETVTVAGRSPDIQPRSGERGFTLQSEAVQNIAVNGRSFFGLIGIVPGVVAGAVAGGGVASGPPTSASQFSANGQRPNSNNVTVDGVANIDTGDNGGNMATTNLDAVAEFKVLTSSYQAEYGRAVGAQVQVVTKSGTQNFRGSGYWYGRRSEWNANTWLNNRAGIPLPDSSRNDMGYTLGGPIYIPGRFNAEKRKLFFFWAQEWQRRKDPVSEVRERKGDFSQSVDVNGNLWPYIRDYTTGLPCSAANTSGCFRDGGVLGKIPEDRLYAPTLAALSVYPLPNVTGQKGYNYKSQTPSNQPRREELIRVDYQASDNWRLAGRYMQDSDNQEQPYGLGFSNVDTFEGHNDVPGRNWMVSTTGILNNTTSLEVSVGSAHNSVDLYTTNQDLTRSAAGMSSLPMLFPNAVQDDMIPTLAYGGGRIGSPAVYFLALMPLTGVNTTYDVIANVTKVLGPHALKAGVYYQKSLKDQSASTSFNGTIYFNNDSNNQYDSSHPYANAALGIYQQFVQASVYAKGKWRYTNLEWYVQDNWRTNDKLTLDYGVRFYYLTPQWDVSQQASNFLPGEYDLAKTVRLYAPAVINGVRRGYDAVTGQAVSAVLIGRVVPNSGDPFNGTFQAGQGIDKTLSSGAKFAASPRVGFAYDITGKQSLVARGGFGILYDRPQGNTVFNLLNNPPGLQVQTLTWGRFQDFATAKPLNTPVALYPTEYDWKLPTVYTWNVGLQVRLPHQFTLDVAYVGSESRNQLQQRPLNAPPYGTAYLASSRDPTRGQTCAGCSAVSAIPGGNALPTDFLRPYQGYGTITLWEFKAYSDYRALQTTLSRRFTKGLMLSATYTRSQARGTVNDDFGTARIDGKDREANYGILAIDRPHNFVVGFVYQTPLVASGALAVLANDWQLSGAYLFMSGNPYTISYSIPGITSTNLTGTDQAARIALVGDPGPGWSSDPYRQVNAAAFAPPQPGSTGMESPRYFVYAPWVNTLNLSVSKFFPLGGRRRLEVRLDAFNALNHTQFAAINSTVTFKSLTDPTITNLPYDANGNLVNINGIGTVSGVRPPRQLQLVTRFSF